MEQGTLQRLLTLQPRRESRERIAHVGRRTLQCGQAARTEMPFKFGSRFWVLRERLLQTIQSILRSPEQLAGRVAHRGSAATEGHIPDVAPARHIGPANEPRNSRDGRSEEIARSLLTDWQDGR